MSGRHYAKLVLLCPVQGRLCPSVAKIRFKVPLVSGDIPKVEEKWKQSDVRAQRCEMHTTHIRVDVSLFDINTSTLMHA